MNCIDIVFTAILMVASPPSDAATQTAADAICLATEHSTVHPAWLVAYLAKENPDFEAYGQGSDRGIFQINLKWNGHRLQGNPLDYYAQANAAVEIIEDNVAKFGNTWQAISAYNSWNQATKKSEVARSYFLGWREKLYRIAPLWGMEVAHNNEVGHGS